MHGARIMIAQGLVAFKALGFLGVLGFKSLVQCLFTVQGLPFGFTSRDACWMAFTAFCAFDVSYRKRCRLFPRRKH